METEIAFACAVLAQATTTANLMTGIVGVITGPISAATNGDRYTVTVLESDKYQIERTV